ncbi:3-methylcrotonyl-CoA carboxylase [Leisingera sp. ANG-M1]|uniref:acetyl/propionyl/methylcrotonyl-CoA carboxylase subunit alpha n=1 Tax=Leisingera sp. ANG-M1 TaxID=1577895 RepID=UPI00057D6FE6|nr:acetyl-CoA carboxylase biotin carboxylase subunit [Leisingera sp. ANG-M1]KIC11786.1 3-methylcrotonyl-CoA carboxylase [Leisingera sp. ANG-M1]
MGSFDTILVANRGEIALRVMRTARAMGLKCVAVYSDADACSPHVAFADHTVRIGEGPAAGSYLSIERIIKAARDAGAGAVHPGYGFLSENAAFARACAKAGLVFIGPPPDVIALMGNKAAAKRKMAATGVRCVPGYEGADQSADVLKGEALRIGFPVMIKAAAGGGGKGMRLVETAEEFRTALELARSEALAAFGSDEVILERALARPRHVEVQIFGDTQGSVIHLGERDCSVQRRHQKVVEEAPGPAVDADLRARMGAAAVAAAQAIGYQGAGTVEFLLDEMGDYFFLEMNTRLQVEHPVTEMITGLDLVEMQIRVARGEALGLTQEDVQISGHAIEARLYAEDPAQGFLPQAGRIADWQPPAGAGIRVDSGIAAGQEVSSFYDPLLAKVTAHGRTREEARLRLRAALQETVLFGLACNRDFLLQVMDHPEFSAGNAATDFIASHSLNAEARPLDSREIALAAALLYRAQQQRFAAKAGGISQELLGWPGRGVAQARFRLAWDDGSGTVQVRETDAGLTVAVADARHVAAVTGTEWMVDGARAGLRAWLMQGRRLYAATRKRLFSLTLEAAGRAVHAEGGPVRVTAPMHGKLLEICVTEGEDVAAGSRLAVLEAMKMQHEIRAAAAGTVMKIAVQEGVQVVAGDLLLETAERDFEPPG